jgi:hypothetical protein
VKGFPPENPPRGNAGKPKSNAWGGASRLLLGLVTPPSQFLLTPWGAILLTYANPIMTQKKLAPAAACGGLFVFLPARKAFEGLTASIFNKPAGGRWPARLKEALRFRLGQEVQAAAVLCQCPLRSPPPAA